MPDLAGRVPHDASQMYARNVMALLGVMTKDGELSIDMDDEILAGCCVTHGGEVVHPVVRRLIETGTET